MAASDPAQSSGFPRQLSWRALMLGMLLSVILAAANAYLGLFAGMTVSASIPAAVVSMAVLRWLRNVHVLEHNIVQTAASAGEAIAAGAIFTLPALILMNYWSDFAPGWVMLICGVGGLLGVVFTIPLRHALIIEQQLPFPEGKATATVLQAGGSRHDVRVLLWGALAGGLAKLAEAGLRLWPASVGAAWPVGQGAVYLGTSLSPALLAVGLIVGRNVGVLIFAGGVIAWCIAIPLYANFSGETFTASGADLAWQLWSTRIRYLGVGAMLVGGLWALWSMRGAIVTGLRQVAKSTRHDAASDLPRSSLVLLLLVLIVPMYLLYRNLLGSAVSAIPLTGIMLLAAFVFSAVAAYMAGLVGSSNNPISGVTIATILLTALGLLWFMGDAQTGPVVAVLIGAVVCCAAAIGGDTMQDLKAGHLLNASPWRQQLAQMLGVVSAVLVLAPVLSLLLHAYGIGTPTPEHPHPLPAPQAHLMAAVALGVFGGQLPWPLVGAGAGIGALVIVVDEILRRRGSAFRVPVLAVAVGIYLPLELSAPIALGALLAQLSGQAGGARGTGMLAAAGLITGEALMGVGLAVPIVLSRNPEVLSLGWQALGAWPGLAFMLVISLWLWRLRNGSTERTS
jgi:putative OPT family oligopeptide transporter